jgi:hypothetical protein
MLVHLSCENDFFFQHDYCSTHQVLLVLNVEVTALVLLFALVLMVLIVEVIDLDGADLFPCRTFWTFWPSWACQNIVAYGFAEVFFVVRFQLRIGMVGFYDQIHGFFV